MNIKIDHIAKMEGHAGFMASVLNGDVKSAKLEVQEGVRLIEGILIGRHFQDVPIIAQRICGICPVVHNLTAIKAIERAMKVTVSDETINLRKLLEWGQIIHSHALHLFFLSLADFLDIENDLKLVDEYSEEAKKALEVRQFGLDLVQLIGGRVIHPLTNEVGGFKKVPHGPDVQKFSARAELALESALELGVFLKKIKLPEFSRPTEYVSLKKLGEYAIYDGGIMSSRGLNVPVKEFEENFHEFQRPQEIVKRVESDGKTSYMVGAIARVNNQSKYLNHQALRYLESLGFALPDFNPFHNVLFQMVEIIQAIEESIKLLRILTRSDLTKAWTGPYEIREGSGAAAVEAPRGTLYYHISVDWRGYVSGINIITPTAQFLSHLEDDITAYLPRILDLSDREKQRKLRAFIRAYDPCISCAVH
jgi:sulfhydrogenase subunit alpha